MQIIWHRISIQTLLFQACLPTRQNGVWNRDNAYYKTEVSRLKSCFNSKRYHLSIRKYKFWTKKYIQDEKKKKKNIYK